MFDFILTSLYVYIYIYILIIGSYFTKSWMFEGICSKKNNNFKQLLKKMKLNELFQTIVEKLVWNISDTFGGWNMM